MPTLFDQLHETAPLVSVGVLTADLRALGAEVELLAATGVKLVHFDVMDGVFCPMTTFGPPVVAACKSRLFRDVHLMIDEPLTKLDAYVAAGADIVTVHVESTRHIHRVFQTLANLINVNDASRGVVRGVALNPGTPIEAVQPLFDCVEYILLLAVNPGWGGQKFIPSTRQRLAHLQRLRQETKRKILIGVDGGITRDNVAEIAALGADIIVTGSAVFDGKNAAANAAHMLQAVKLP
ncbi:MAG: ribulose-phosphate 3-epimerase [Opitutaceae bacterium]|nr:ribulose-phosphate 3-epimerase [Opitutaceae bacterium]